jgi:hypothetical protein
MSTTGKVSTYKDIISLIQLACKPDVHIIVKRQEDTFLVKEDKNNASAGKPFFMQIKSLKRNNDLLQKTTADEYSVQYSASTVKIFDSNGKELLKVFVNKKNSEFYVEDSNTGKITTFPIYGLFAKKLNNDIKYKDPLFSVQHSNGKFLVSVPFSVPIEHDARVMEVANLVIDAPQNKLYYYLETLPEYRFITPGKWSYNLADVIYFKAYESVYMIGKLAMVPDKKTDHSLKVARQYSENFIENPHMQVSSLDAPFYLCQHDPESHRLAVVYIEDTGQGHFVFIDVYDAQNGKMVVSHKALCNVNKKFFYMDKAKDNRTIVALLQPSNILYFIDAKDAKVDSVKIPGNNTKVVSNFHIYNSGSTVVAYYYTKSQRIKILFIVDKNTFYDFRNKHLYFASQDGLSSFFSSTMTVTNMQKSDDITEER